MSKYLKLYGGAAIGTTIMLLAAHNFSDRAIAPMPTDAPRMIAENDRDWHLIARVEADTAAADAPLGLGRAALPQEVAAWDLDVSPDGTGLPAGSGDVWTGEEVFADRCAVCHGDFAEGRDNWPKLAGGEGTLDREDPLKTVGSYWPYLSTAWDYVHRSMPFGDAQTLTYDEVYAIVAYILYSNDLVDDDFVLTKENFLSVEMPNADGFIIDDRADTEYPIWRTEPCMDNCKDSVAITMRAAVLDVTPEEEGAETSTSAAAPVAAAPAAVPTETAAATAPDPAVAAIDADLAAKGEKVFKKCKACHKVGEGAKNGTGPMLNGIVGRQMASVDGFRYSGGLADMGAAGDIWSDEALAAFLAKPKAFLPGTKMSFSGLRKPDDIAAVTEYLKTFAP